MSRRFILDTNICLAYIPGNKLYEEVDKQLGLSNKQNLAFISVVTKAELLSLGVQNGWGPKKMNLLKKYINKMIILNISTEDDELLNAYAKIDAYSQGRLKNGPALGMSARNMGKNDLWIAATAFVAKAELVTTDSDFDHLPAEWISVHKFRQR